MSALVDIFQLNPAASAFGTAGLVCQLVWPLFRRRRTIMSVQFGIGASYSLHYALMDAWSGAGLAGLGATQSAIVFLAGDRPWLRWVSFALLPVAVAICYATWSGLPSILALTALTLIMIGRMQRDTLQRQDTAADGRSFRNGLRHSGRCRASAGRRHRVGSRRCHHAGA